MADGIENLLASVRNRKMGIKEASHALRKGHLPGGKHARIDFRRAERTGMPEVILAEGKDPEHLVRIVNALVKTSQGALISRLEGRSLALLEDLSRHDNNVQLVKEARMAVINPEKHQRFLKGRSAAILTAGTADSAVAEEARVALESFGARVFTAYDVGVAGIHRLHDVLDGASEIGAGVYIVCAGREGALPTVVAGLVDRPVIGVPTSKGYGRGGKGEGALTAMLQSCQPLAVVNIDGGIPAALLAAQMLRWTPAPSKKVRSVR